MNALAQYGAALRRAAGGAGADLDLIDPAADRPPRRLEIADWCGHSRPGDAGLLARCTGPTLDVGCGPGRLTAALVAAGRSTLGIDISAEAVRQARRRGAPAVRGDVFSAVPGSGGWCHVLLADGNIGIGGDPGRLLTRCASLLADGGDLLVELDPPGTGSWRGPVALRHRKRTSTPFPWAAVAIDDITDLADRTLLRVLETWRDSGRFFARIAPARPSSGR